MGVDELIHNVEQESNELKAANIKATLSSDLSHIDKIQNTFETGINSLSNIAIKNEIEKDRVALKEEETVRKNLLRSNTIKSTINAHTALNRLDQSTQENLLLLSSLSYSDTRYNELQKEILSKIEGIHNAKHYGTYNPDEDEFFALQTTKILGLIQKGKLKHNIQNRSNESSLYFSTQKDVPIKTYLNSPATKGAYDTISSLKGEEYALRSDENAQTNIIKSFIYNKDYSVDFKTQQIKDSTISNEQKASLTRLLTKQIIDSMVKQSWLDKPASKEISTNLTSMMNKNPYGFSYIESFVDKSPEEMSEIANATSKKIKDLGVKQQYDIVTNKFVEIAKVKMSENMYDFLKDTNQINAGYQHTESRFNADSSRVFNAIKQFTTYGNLDFFSSGEINILKAQAPFDSFSNMSRLSNSIKGFNENPIYYNNITTSTNKMYFNHTTNKPMNMIERLNVTNNHMNQKIFATAEKIKKGLGKTIKYRDLLNIQNDEDVDIYTSLFKITENPSVKRAYRLSNKVREDYNGNEAFLQVLFDLGVVGKNKNLLTSPAPTDPDTKKEFAIITTDDLNEYFSRVDQNPFYKFGNNYIYVPKMYGKGEDVFLNMKNKVINMGYKEGDFYFKNNTPFSVLVYDKNDKVINVKGNRVSLKFDKVSN